MSILEKLFYKFYYPARAPFLLLRRWLSYAWLLAFCFIAACIARFLRKRYDVGLGPLPLINNVYHKRALEKYGYTAHTFVANVYGITSEFDYIARERMSRIGFRLFLYSNLFWISVRNYRCLYIYFNGGILGHHPFMWRFEAWLYRVAKVRTVVTAYGADVQDFTRSTNLLFINSMAKDYPRFKYNRRQIIRSIDLWSLEADHIIAGCDWVEYLYHWDTLMLAHFSIDTSKWAPPAELPEELRGTDRPLRILHAPNHRTVKGSRHFIKAVEELKAEGLNIELVILQKVPNEEVRRMIERVDIVADQLIVGWYAMFALEAMTQAKPLLCFLRRDFEELFIEEGLVQQDEIPIINCNPFTVKETIRDLYKRREELPEIGRRSREFILKHHSTEYVGSVFDRINKQIGILPSKSNAS